MSFSNTPTNPGKASLTSPSGTVSSTHTPIYTWNKDAPSTYYLLSVMGPGGSLINNWYASTTICGNTVCAVTPSVSLPNGDYSWKVEGWNPIATGAWSDTKNFTEAVSP